MKYAQILCILVAGLHYAAGQPTYVDCDRTLNRVGAACGLTTDVLSCSTIMSSTPIVTNSLFFFPACVEFNEVVSLALPGSIRVFHASGGTAASGDVCGGGEVLVRSSSGVGTVSWTAPGSTADIVIMLASRPSASFGQVTLQEATIPVRSSCVGVTSAPTPSSATQASTASWLVAMLAVLSVVPLFVF